MNNAVDTKNKNFKNPAGTQFKPALSVSTEPAGFYFRKVK